MRNALVVFGGWAGHEPEDVAGVLRRWLHEDGFSVRMESDPAVFADPAIHDLSVIIPVLSMGKAERPAIENLAKAIESGVGLAGQHGGMADAFRDMPNYQFITGGQWVAHPGNVIDYTVDIAKPDDPIMQGIKSFPYTSEQYYMHVDPANEVLATTTFSGDHSPWIRGVVMPQVWKKMYGAGRVFYSALGHSVAEFENPNMATILRRGINWAARTE